MCQLFIGLPLVRIHVVAFRLTQMIQDDLPVSKFLITFAETLFPNKTTFIVLEDYSPISLRVITTNVYDPFFYIFTKHTEKELDFIC